MATIDLSGLPTAYLEAYPFPSFALVVPVLPRTRPKLFSRDTDITVRQYEDVSPLSGPSTTRAPLPWVWANERWMQLSQGKQLRECLDSNTLDRLYSWAEGEDQQGFCFRMSLRQRGAKLSLAKTMVPLSPPSPTHAFCVITSQRIEPTSSSDGSMGTPSTDSMPRSSVSSSASYFEEHRASQSTSTDVGTSFSISESGLTPSDIGGIPTSASSSGGSQKPSKARSSTRPRPRRPTRPSDIGAPSILDKMHIAAAESWKLLEAIDWENTAMGPRHLWADTVDPIISMTFFSNTQDCLWLGEELNLVYNHNYMPLVKHPESFGKPGKEVWGTIWDYLEPLIDKCLKGIPTYKENDLLFYEKWGIHQNFLEKYHTWRYVPIAGHDGRVIGIHNQSMETTEHVLAERRLSTVRELSEHMIVARSRKEYYHSIGEVLEQNPRDAPFALVYSIEPQKCDNMQQHLQLSLQTNVGVPEHHHSAPDKLAITIATRNRAAFGANADRMSSPTLSAISALSSGSGRIYHAAEGSKSWPIVKALSTRQCVIVEDLDQLIEGFPIRAWDKLPNSAIVVPICSDSTIEIPEAVMILGLNVLRPFDADYDSWVHVIRAQMTSSLTSVKAYEEEHRRMEDAARMEKAKAAWFRGAAHDLRSPLTLICGPIDDLLDTTLSEGQRHALTTAKRNAERLTRLVNALMDFSRLEAGRVEARFSPVDLGTFISDLANIFRPAVERMKIVYNIDIEPHEDMVYIDPVLFETVVSNLIGNALKYTESGSITVKLSYGEFAEVSVIDTGVGIPQDEISQVAQWYHRATTAIHAGTQGSGLGLALAKELLHLHGGDLVVTSRTAAESENEEHGSTFTARIPLSPKNVPVITTTSPEIAPLGQYGKAVANEAMRWSREDSDATSDANSEPMTVTSNPNSRFSDGLMFQKSDIILVVDDNHDMREYIKQIFSSYCKVYEATNGIDALEKMAQHPPDLVISDLMMPKMNGLELLDAIRKHDKFRITPFIMMSAVTGDDARVDALIMGAEDYISKPFKPKELLARGHLHMQVGKKRTKLERLYAQREAEIAVLSDYCPSGIMKADNSGSLTYVNSAWLEFNGMRAEDDPNLWSNNLDPETRERILNVWIPFVNDTSPNAEKELRVNWKWATTGRSMQGVFVRLDLCRDGMSGILGCMTDITYEEERVIEAEKRRLEAEESKHQQELLIDLTSHEIRTPVSAILQCSSLVKDNLTSLHAQLRTSGQIGFKPTPELLADLEEDLEALESIYQCGLVQERIAGDVLSLARIQLDMLSLYDVEMDLRKEANKVISVFSSEAKMKKIDLVTEFGSTLDKAKITEIKTDPVRLGQVVTNLISNAIRFTASSDVRRITVRYEISFLPPPDDTCALPSSIGIPNNVPAEEDTPIWLFVSVRDTGPGLGPKELAMLFKRFSQGNKMIHTRYGGSGLGLFICRKITELLGGRIEVQSQLGNGSVFRFFIKTRTVKKVVPLAVPPSEIPTPTSTSMESRPSTISRVSSPSSSITSTSDFITSDTPPPPGIEDLHILIVEDNVINQKVLKRQIVKAGLTCDVAGNGLEALNLIREADRQRKRSGEAKKKLYNVILMDLEMPVMDGLTAVKEIRASEEAGTMSRQMVIALTGNARQGQIDQAMAAGMDDVVIKPYVLSNLLKKIQFMSNKKLDYLPH